MVDEEGFEIPDGTIVESMVPSRNATCAAYVVRDGTRQHAEINGEPLPAYDGVAGLTFSADSSRLAYAARRGASWFVVSDSQEWGPYDDVGKSSPVFSPDSRHIAYTALRGRRWHALMDGAELGGPYEGFSPGGIVFAPDSGRIAYSVKRGESWLIVANGEEQGPFAGIIERSLVFSPDSRKLACVACVRTCGFLGWGKKVKACVVTDGTPGALYDFDPKRGNSIGDEIVFGPDSTRLAYAVARRGRCCWVVDGVEGTFYRGFVSGWGAHPGWTRFPDYGKTLCRKHTLSFSADSRHFAYAAADTDRHVFVYDGAERGRHPAIVNRPVLFSSDSRHVVYAAEEAGKQFYVLDGQALGAHYGTAGDSSFCPNSALFAYVAMENDQRYFLVVGSRHWDMPGAPMIGSNLVWDSSDRLHALIARRRRLVVVRYKVR